jgi:murein DD-endopeptidase MepM/ murein hydrolase activator NlpD
MGFKLQTGWAAWVSAVLMTLPLLSGCSSVAPSHTGRHGLFDDLAEGGRTSRSHSRSGRAIAVQDLPERPTGNPVIDKPKSKRERAERAAAVEASPKAVELKNAGLRWPLGRVEVTSPFGKRGHEFHEGIDLRANMGTPIFAAQTGTVIYADSKIRGYGRMVVIKHREGLATVYAHASRLLVHKGQKVKMGQKIAISGKSGHATGPHLHFEVRSGVVAVNPYQFLPKQEVAAFEPTPTPNRRKAHARSTVLAMRSGSRHSH